MTDETSARPAIDIRRAYLDTAAVAESLLRDAAVAAAWDQPSALAKLPVSGLAGHLGRQVLQVQRILAQQPSREELAQRPSREEPVSLLEHYTRSAWVAADLDDEINVTIRRDGSEEAAAGPVALVDQVEAARQELATVLPAEPEDRPVHLPWGPWTLTLTDFLTTRLLEILIHCDDLAVSVGVPTPELPPAALDRVLPLLCRLAAQRHGSVAVLRALSRAERAPATISAL